MTRTIWIVALCLLGGPLSAAPVPVPLTLDWPYLERQAAEALGMDADGQVTIRPDPCGRFEGSALELRPADAGRLAMRIDVAADLATEVMGSCLGPGRWQGRLHVELMPVVDETGLVVLLRPESASLLSADSEDGVLTALTRTLAESLILPRIRAFEADLREPLSAIDELLVSLAPDQRTSVSRQATVLSAVEVVPEGMRATLAVDPGETQPDTRAERPLSDDELEDWRRVEDELDGFLTTVVINLAERTGDTALRQDLAETLLDARWSIARALVEEEPGPDPVRRLFVDSWDRLRPHLRLLDSLDLPPEAGGLRLAGFIAGGDAIQALDALGPAYGLEITRDGLRRLARLLLADDAPDRFTPLPLEVDPRLRLLFPEARATWQLEEAVSRASPLDWLIRPAAADSARSPAVELRGMVPRLANLDHYLGLVSALMDQEIPRRTGGETRIPPVFRYMMDPMIRATAWKESCWRQYTGPSSAPRVLTSSVGALGMMQIHARVWRGVYDLDRLADDVRYNLNAGIDILEYYFVDYALRRGEHRQPGGLDNLVQATYAAYNGGPSHLGRYRRDDTRASLRAIDREFWHHYQTMRRDRWPDVGSCYPVGG
ncbi:hypothetical protein J2T57_003102 [Natronocella acetinitrilica]|uniref:Transglycosylase SLT domain-containing protein n=1 Tax=Natronocella acetinitrilica TaxID=414046 RepID=A0AAE3G5U8_9GAMM|nr:transglycosylase SLT domain-containing protein [Natronocella acetinitrilica]MCP1675947.1 hypothetical protein [Natronocella acetinitrilica]